jgi:predicted metal-dependent hydrolase
MYPQAYLEYLIHFHGDRDYFECHEVLEEYWKSIPTEERSDVWVGLIQVAVAMYHQRRNNLAGAVKMMQSAIGLLEREQEAVKQLGLDVTELLRILSVRLEEMRKGVAYASLNLPITDPALAALCRQGCEQRGFSFGQPSSLNNEFLLHKHKLRDRTDVIEERTRQLQAKQARRENP